MSQKRVDIEITGNAEKFKKTAEDVQKKLDKINDAVNDLGDNDAVDKFARKFQRASSYIEDAKDKLETLYGEDGLEQLTKYAEDFADELKKGEIVVEDIADSLKELEKLNLYKLSEAFKDAMKDMKALGDENKNLINQFNKLDDESNLGFFGEGNNGVLLDKDLFTAIKRELGSLEDVTEDTAKEFIELVDNSEELNRVQFNYIVDEIEKLSKVTKDLNMPLVDIKKLMDEIDGEGLDDLQKEFKDVEKISANLAITMQSVSKAFKDFDKDFGKSISNNEMSLQGFENSLGNLIVIINEIKKRTNDTFGRMEKMFKNITESVENTTKETKDFNKEIKDTEKHVENATDKVKDFNKETKDIDKKPLDNFNDTAKDTEKHVENITDEVKDLNKETKDIDDTRFRNLSEGAKDANTHIDKIADSVDKADRKMRDIDVTQLRDIVDFIDNMNTRIHELIDSYKELGRVAEGTSNKLLGDLDGSGKIKIDGSSDKGSNSFMDNVISGTTEAIIVGKTLENTFEGITDATEKTTKAVSEVGEELKDISMQWKNLTNPDTEWADNFNFADKEQIQAIKEYLKDIKELEDEYAKLEEECSKLTEEQQQMIRSFLDGDTASDELDDSIKDLALSMNKVRMETEAYKQDNEHMALTLKNLDKIMVDSVESYEKIKQEVIDFIKSNKGAAASNKYVAESFMNLHNSMKEVYADIKPLPDDILEQLNKEAKELKDSFDLISTEQLMKQLERMGKIIDDTTEKTKEFKQLNKEGWGTKNAANNIVDSMKDMQSFADDMAACVEKVGDEYVFLGDRVKKANKEFDTEKINEYKEALSDYVKFLRDTGGQVSKAFAGEDGQLDVQKFFKAFEQFGRPLNQINAELQKNKTQILESIKAQKEHREELQKAADAARDAAKEIRDQAKAQLQQAEAAERAAKANGSQEDLAKATKEVADAKERLAKAEKEYTEAAERAKNIDNQRVQDAKDLVKAFNEQAEAARKLGASIKDITEKDIASFDKSLASLLDDAFDNDLPKTFEDIKEDFTAIFSDITSLDLGGVFDGLKDVGAGILDKIPDKLKLAAGQALALSAALKQCAEWGVDQFLEGLDTIKGALSSAVGLARDIGSEIRDAFENITGMDLDLGSLIEIPVNFESQLAKAGAIAGATGDALKELEDEARRLGATTRYSATEVAEAMEYMGMAGWTNQEILAGLEEVLDLATVSGMDLGAASDFVTDGLTALGMEAGDAAKMVDILAAASTSSNTSVEQMQRAFTNCAPVAGTLGINLRDLTLALGLMADKGVKGAKAGTALKNLMANLSAPTEKQLSYIKKFNLEGAQQKIVNGDLVGGIKEMQAALSKLTPQQKNAIITTIAGKEALSGISALLNTTEEDLADLEKALDNCDGAASEMADNFDNTLKGALLGLSSAMQERLLQIFDQCEESIKGVTKQFTEFFNIWNGFSEKNGSGLADAMAYLSKASEGWSKAIADNLEKAIGAIDEFINGGVLDDMLQIGTNIINGIADGIRRAAEDGTLGNAITTAIRKLGTWFSENLETVVEIGREIINAISQGIEENSDLISEVIRQVIDMQTELEKTIAYEKWKLIGSNLAMFIHEGFMSKATSLFSGIGGFLSGLFTGNGGVKTDPNDPQNWTYTDPITGDTYGPGVKNGESYSDGVKKGVNNKKEDVGNAINKNFEDAKVKTDATASKIGEGISDNILKKLETMDTGALSELRTEMENLQTTIENVASSIGKSFGLIREYARTEIVGMTNIFRNQFVNVTNITRNQMVNVSNIIRNQALNWTNIFKNQMKNSRDEVTKQMLSMASVTRTQMTNISNIIRNQSKNARDSLTSQFISMAKVVSTQMKNCLSSVKSYMSQIKSQTSKTMTLNVNTSTSSYSATPATASALYAANAASAFSIGDSGNMSTLSSRASSVSSTMSSSYTSGASSNGLLLEIPLVVDGRELARSSAQYMNGEIKKITKRNDRKRGVK